MYVQFFHSWKDEKTFPPSHISTWDWNHNSNSSFLSKWKKFENLANPKKVRNAWRIDVRYKASSKVVHQIVSHAFSLSSSSSIFFHGALKMRWNASLDSVWCIRVSRFSNKARQWVNKIFTKLDWKNGKRIASAGNRTRINCLEGSYADHYTTDALQELLDIFQIHID